MATRSHSRFTDDIFCTPAPTAPEIEVRKKEDLHDEIFPRDSYKDLRKSLIAAEELKSKDLYEKYPPQFTDKNKTYILKLLNKKKNYLPTPNKSILITRWKPILPLVESNQSHETKIVFKQDTFDYKGENRDQTVEWYLNFANNDIFRYYAGSLLAQDELQVLECIELAAVREYLAQTTNTVGSFTVGSNTQTHKPLPTPILISNTERVINLDIKDFYGNRFAEAKEDELQRICRIVEPPQKVNLIAIEAPKYGEGIYTDEQIQFILITCYTGFKTAQILASKTHAMNKGQTDQQQQRRRSNRDNENNFRTVIHTGWWGCGAYGNNRRMMILTQILAAHWAQIDEIVFHVQNKEHEIDYKFAEEVAKNLYSEKNVDKAVEYIVNLNLKWEKSNDT